MHPTGPIVGLIGGVLPYLAVAVFLTGVVVRLLRWRALPQPGLMTVFPTEGAGAGALLKEALLFPSLYRGDRALWLPAWGFHVMLAVAFAGHIRAISAIIDGGFAAMGASPEAIARLSSIIGGAVGVVLLAALLLLLGRRAIVHRVREISSAPDYVGLVLLCAVVLSGNWLRLGGSVSLAETRSWAASLIALSPVVPTTPAVVLHIFCAEVLVLYIAFSKLMHFGGFFFTFSLVKRSEP